MGYALKLKGAVIPLTRYFNPMEEVLRAIAFGFKAQIVLLDKNSS